MCSLVNPILAGNRWATTLFEQMVDQGLDFTHRSDAALSGSQTTERARPSD